MNFLLCTDTIQGLWFPQLCFAGGGGKKMTAEQLADGREGVKIQYAYLQALEAYSSF